MQALCVADDTTGALEIGAKFAVAGVRCAVWLDVLDAGQPDRPAAVLDLATRHLKPERAAQRVVRVAKEARRTGVPHFYLKTDSTLRGPIAAEFGALLDAWPDRPLVYVPAYPAMGRTVRQGVLYVDGRPVAQTSFGHDPREPVEESSILRLLARGCPAPLALVRSSAELEDLLARRPGGQILVCDGCGEADLEAIARVLAAQANPPLVAGTGGFAAHWFPRLSLPREAPGMRIGARRWLVVNGSLHPRSREQTAKSDLPRVGERGQWPPAASWALVETPRERAADPARPARQLAEVVARAVRENNVEGLIIFGGDTVRAVLEALAVRALEAGGELLTGIPVSRALDGSLFVVSKAGGFGPTDVLLRIREEIERWK
ncbi:MAG: four-carbon acid sugar kinase family protein [Bryobacterales bacterium]|nr:four-carbon acid sugar kinase family protein [Bryobacteraceae bacterium]MDW8130818.1 four-carbon acid sugar kinase family protein [Bryobacterales bacterium]